LSEEAVDDDYDTAPKVNNQVTTSFKQCSNHGTFEPLAPKNSGMGNSFN